jgi:peptidoglycan/xylan/chitin deacetylase (PgdA/CDA1 family)
VSFTCLAYHQITSASSDDYAVSPARFAAQLDWLVEQGFTGLGLSAALEAEAAGQAGRRVALTFDDGTADFAEAAWPLLRARGLGATVFVLAGRVGGRADWDGPRGARLMDWSALRALAAEGVEVAAHGLTHRPLDTLSPAEALAGLRAAHGALSAQGLAPRGLAYPYGRGGAMVAQAAAAAGFAWGATARGGRNSARMPRFALRRTLVTGRAGRVRFALLVRSGYARLVEWRMDLRRVP